MKGLLLKIILRTLPSAPSPGAHHKGSRNLSTQRHTTLKYRGAGKSLARPGTKQATATEDFEFHISYL